MADVNRRNTYKQDEVLDEPFNFRHLLRAWKYIKKYSSKMIVALLLSAIGGIAALYSPKITKYALDEVVPAGDKALLVKLALLLLGIFIVSIVFITIRSRIMVKVSQSIIYDIRKDLFAHLQKLPFSYYDSRPAGKILVRVINYVNSVSDILSNGIINAILEIINIIFESLFNIFLLI